MNEPATRPYRMRARREAVERTRERIFEATHDLWLDRPYDELTLDAVAERAGVTRQTVLRHFGSKDGLVLATAAWFAPAEDARRAVTPGDVAGAVARIVERNEEMGDANVRLLELEGRIDTVDELLARGRASHRVWIETTFAPLLPGDAAERETTVLALYAATDVTVWKLLRRDLGCPAEHTGRIIATLVDGALGAAGPDLHHGGTP